MTKRADSSAQNDLPEETSGARPEPRPIRRKYSDADFPELRKHLDQVESAAPHVEAAYELRPNNVVRIWARLRPEARTEDHEPSVEAVQDARKRINQGQGGPETTT